VLTRAAVGTTRRRRSCRRPGQAHRRQDEEGHAVRARRRACKKTKRLKIKVVPSAVTIRTHTTFA
jgi:hypothetical protein